MHGADSDGEEAPERLQYKVVLLGDGTVGKTSLATRFTQDRFAASYKQTIGLDFFLRAVELPGRVSVAMQLWDIGGQTLGSRMVGKYVYGAQAVLLVYDVSNYQSFLDLEDWLALVRRTFGSHPPPYIALVANKADLALQRFVKEEQHEEFAAAHGLYSFYVSAKTGDNVTPTFLRIAADLAGVGLTQRELNAVAPVTRVERQPVAPAEPAAASGRAAAAVPPVPVPSAATAAAAPRSAAAPSAAPPPPSERINSPRPAGPSSAGPGAPPAQKVTCSVQ